MNAPVVKPVLLWDIEVYRNYFLVAFRNPLTGNVRHFEQFEGQLLDVATLRKIIGMYTLVGFNTNNFDLPLLSLALTKVPCERLKEASDAIITGGLKPWTFEARFGINIVKADTIDIFEVAPGTASLKIYGGRMHTKKMQDLPIDPGACISVEDRASLREYCGNDLVLTGELYERLKPQIALREEMSKTYGMDLRSKSDAQIAEAVIVSEVAKLKGENIYRPTIPPGTQFRYKAPAWMKFEGPILSDLLKRVEETIFVVSKKGGVEMPALLADLKVKIGEGIYRLGIGGCHSSEESVSIVSSDGRSPWEFDVVSYYPAIILLNGLYPPHMGETFLTVYRDIVARRVAAKKSGDKVTADALKITSNGTYGKLASMWSKLYAPQLMIQVTLTGQLALLMLIEKLEGGGYTVVSANTDGLSVMVPDGDPHVDAIVKEWERATGFVTESNRFKVLHACDVNSYVNIKHDGSLKLKGAFAPSGLQKNPQNEICIEAVCAFLKDGVPVKETILKCTDIRKFVTVRQVKGGAVKDGKYIGKAVRWYYARGETGVIRYKENGNTVARSEGGRPLMELPDTLPEDLDFPWYIREAGDLLNDVGYRKLFL